MVENILDLKDISRSFGAIQALAGVDLALKRGEVLGLMGDNGAGKSTLINILSGVHQPDGGEIHVDGRKVEIPNPKSAMNLGIETIYQYNSMVPTMSIERRLSWISLARPARRRSPARWPWVSL